MTTDAVLALLTIATDTISRDLTAMSAYGAMLERHLATQEDDLGSEYALGMRTSLEKMTTAVQLLRSATASGASRQDQALSIAEAAALLKAKLED